MLLEDTLPFIFLMLFCWQAEPPAVLNAGESFLSLAAERKADRGYSRIVYRPGRTPFPVIAKVYPPLGCAVSFSRAYDDAWTSDEVHWKILEWGPVGQAGAPDHKTVVISNLLETDEPANLFFMFGGEVLELVLVQAGAMGESDRRIAIEVQIEKREKRAAPEPPQAETKAEIDPWLLPLRPGHRVRQTAHGTLIYDFSQKPFYAYFRAADDSPPLTVLEVVRGQRVRFGRRLKVEVPLAPTRSLMRGVNHLLLFPHFAVDRGERLYLRVQASGERRARLTKLAGMGR